MKVSEFVELVFHQGNSEYESTLGEIPENT